MSARLGAVAMIACALVTATACGSSAPKTAPAPAAVDARGRRGVEIDARQNQFTPAAVIVDVGTKVAWRNTDTVAHNVQKSADALDFGAPFGADASKFGPGMTYEFTFTKPGTFFYACTIHSLMNGKVEVVAR